MVEQNREERNQLNKPKEHFVEGITHDSEQFEEMFGKKRKHEKRANRSLRNRKSLLDLFGTRGKSGKSPGAGETPNAVDEAIPPDIPEVQTNIEVSPKDEQAQTAFADSSAPATPPAEPVDHSDQVKDDSDKTATDCPTEETLDSEILTAADEAPSADREAQARDELSAGIESLRQKIKEKNFSVGSMLKNQKTKKYCLIIAGAALFAGGIYGAVNGIDYMLHGEKAYAISVDNEPIAMVDSYSTASSVIDDYLDGSYTSTKLKDAHFKDDVQITKVYQPRDTILDYDQAQDKLAKNAEAVAECYNITSDGKTVASLATESDAQQALEMLKKAYTPADSTLKVTEVKFKEDVQVVKSTAPVNDVLAAADAVEQMKKTENNSYTYTVKAGDNLNSICENEGVGINAMTKGSKSVDFEDLQPGDTLKISKDGRLINVLAVLEKTKEEIISYEISYQENAEMPAGTQNVVQEGFDGAEIVDVKIVRINGDELYRERLSAKTTLAPITKVVDCGTKVFRGEGAGNVNITSVNQMIWPTNATAISSPYGVRSSGFHTGLDINGETNDPVWAALDGTVTTAGWCGNYGNCIVVKHSSGLSTRYAHLNSIGVGVGQTVKRGQTIGLEGSTGNSTGSHLHFEVIINGTTVDPLIYISR